MAAARHRRRQGVRHAERRHVRLRMRKWAMAVLGAGLVALAALAVAEGIVPLPEQDYPIRTLKVEGTFERVSREDVAATVAPHAERGFLESDVRAIRGALVDLPWVHAASVRRVWPDALHITLVEERALARWAGGGLVNVDGELFHPPGDALASLPLLEGPPRSTAHVLGQYLALRQELGPLGLEIVGLSMDARRAWELELDNGIRLTLGRRDPEQQVRRFVRFYPEVMAARAADIEEVDLRYTNGFAVRWRASGAPATADAGKKTGDAV